MMLALKVVRALNVALSRTSTAARIQARSTLEATPEETEEDELLVEEDVELLELLCSELVELLWAKAGSTRAILRMAAAAVLVMVRIEKMGKRNRTVSVHTGEDAERTNPLHHSLPIFRYTGRHAFNRPFLDTLHSGNRLGVAPRLRRITVERLRRLGRPAADDGKSVDPDIL